MTHENTAAVIVNDRGIRDLICLNLRFESVKTISYESVREFLDAKPEVNFAIIDLCGERDPENRLLEIKSILGDKVPVITMIDEKSSSLKHDYILEIEMKSDRRRFDASKLIKMLTQLIESSQDEKHLRHPLTGLPSGNAVEKHILSLLASGKGFAIIASDIDNMKAFNQRFGYSEGDNLLIHLVHLMEKSLKRKPDKMNFLGHRGEDDFVIITSSPQALKIAEEIVDGFDDMVRAFFSDKDIDNGYFTIQDGRGNLVKFPITTVSLVVINTEGHLYTHPVELYDAAEEMMFKVKMRGIRQSYCAVGERKIKPDITNVFI